MVRLFKYAFVAFSMFAIYTAAPPNKLAMYSGLVAYGQAMREACLRPDGPCGYAVAVWRSVSTQLHPKDQSKRQTSNDA